MPLKRLAGLGDVLTTPPTLALNRRSDALEPSGFRVAICLAIGLLPTTYPSLLGVIPHHVVEGAAPEA